MHSGFIVIDPLKCDYLLFHIVQCSHRNFSQKALFYWQRVPPEHSQSYVCVCVCIGICMWKIAWSCNQRKCLCSYECNWTTYCNMMNFPVDMQFTKTDYRCIHAGHELLLQLMMCNTHYKPNFHSPNMFSNNILMLIYFSPSPYLTGSLKKSNIFCTADEQIHTFVLRKKETEIFGG